MRLSKWNAKKAESWTQHGSNEIYKSQLLMHDKGFANAGLSANEGVKIAFRFLDAIGEIQNPITPA